MCTFMSTAELRTHNKTEEKKNQSFIDLFLKPNKEGEQYRFRLLYYRQPSKNDRKDPYFSQMIHDHWGTTDKGNKIVDDMVVCPGTKYVKYDEEKYVLNEKTGKKQLNCPICQKANQNFFQWKMSGYKDKISMEKYNQLKAKFRGYVPVYVVNDPNNEKNNGKLKCIIFTNKDEYEEFDKIVQEEKTKAYLSSKNGKPYELFNGENGVDFYIRMEVVPEIVNVGKENEYKREVRKITQMAFGKKPYSIPNINKNAIDSFDFDDKHYVSNIKEELEVFYKKYFGQDEVEIPDEEVDIFSSKPSTPDINTEINNTSINNDTVIETSNNMLDDISSETNKELISNNTNRSLNEQKETESNDIDGLLSELDIS